MADAGYPSIPDLLISVIPEHAYSELTYQPGWRAYLSGWALPAAWIDEFGIAHLRGRVFSDFARPAPPYAIATAPATADGQTETFIQAGSAGPALLSVSDGFVYYQLGSTTAGLWVDLSAITYPA